MNGKSRKTESNGRKPAVQDSIRMLRAKHPHVGHRPGYGTYVTTEAIREWSKVSIADRFRWIEELIRLEASLPAEIRERHRRCREGKIRGLRRGTV